MDFFKKYNSIEELKKEYLGKENFKDMVKKVEELTQDEDFLMYYDLEEKHKHEKESSYELGVERGIKQKEIEIAKKMLKENEQIEKIMNYTGLTKKEIEK